MATDTSGPRPWLANALVALASLVFAALLLLLVEGVLHLVGAGEPDPSRASRLKYQQIVLPVLEAGEQGEGLGIWRTADPRLPYQAILQEKPPGTLRIFTFGGSATAGLGFSPNVTFARELERLLRRFHERPVEVLNLGIVALSSQQVKVLVADACARYRPDLAVVYSGNNEFLELHAEKYARARAGALEAVAAHLRDSNLYRLVDGALRGPPQTPSLAEADFSNEDLRLTQREIVEQVELSESEREVIVDRYERNLDEMVTAARSAGTRVVLMTVASNWKWQGREDLPADWIADLLGGAAPAVPAALVRAREVLDGRIESAPASARSDLLFRRATIAEMLGDYAAARADYRAAMNADPHLRRALDEMNERLRSVAARQEVPLVDTVALLAAQAEHGIVGFGEFYDYVHFTPRGALLVGAALRAELVRLGVVSAAPDGAPAAFVRRREAWLEALREDPLAVDEWLGFGFDPSGIADRDLWKYERMVAGLDERIAADPRDVRALVYRGNARAFEIDGAEAAARDYRAALEVAPGLSPARSNLEHLAQGGRLRSGARDEPR